jgi:hypothetical protein
MNLQRITIARLLCRPTWLGLILVLATPAIAVSLDAYKAKIDSARRLAVALEDSIRKNELDDSVRLEFAAHVRSDFPASERIEWQGGVVETSNDWLLDKARSVESENDSTKVLPNVVEIREYLSAIHYKIEELEQSETGTTRTKDEDKQKLAEILRREEYQKPQEKEESIFQKWLREFLEWLENLFPKPSGTSQGFSGMGTLASVLRIVLYIGLGGLLLFLAYKIVPLFFPALARVRKPRKKKERVILGERLSENETASDLFGEAERLAREGNLRGAIRKGYVALLCDLSDRRVIGLSRSKTNRDYLRDVRTRSELYPRMQVVTDTFERHWYGAEESAESDWSRFRDEYQDAIRSV